MVLQGGMATAITATVPAHQPSASMSLMSCVRESSPPLHLDSGTEQEIDKNEPSKKRRFHPFRGLRKMFRRKVRHSGGDEIITGIELPTPESETPNMDSHRSRSTSELLAGDEPTRRKSGTSGFYSGHGCLSVSHDSVFTGDPHSGSDLELDTAQSSSSLSIQQLVLPGVRAELLDAVRRRRARGDTSEDDEDLGLPRSPCNSPITTDTLLEKAAKEHTTKSHSTCSDGSLLSMGSSEMDDDSFGLHSRHSSKVSLHEKKPPTSINLDTESELDLGDCGSVTTPLSHSAARHKMSVRPKRTHGAPRRRRVQQITSGTALPTTPEVNEETVRSTTPETTKQDTTTPMLSSTPGIIIPPETRLKSASLPPGLALSSAIAAGHHLSRSRSNAAGAVAVSPLVPRSMSHDKELDNKTQRFDEEDEIIEKKKEESFFGRLLSRRSGKKKKERVDEITVNKKESIFTSMNIKKRIDEKGRYVGDEMGYVKIKSGPAARQRVDPIDLPESTDLITPPIDIPVLHKLPPTGLVKTPSPNIESPIVPRQKRMDAYAKVLDTSTKIVNEEIAFEKHPRQRKIEPLIEPPPMNDFPHDRVTVSGISFNEKTDFGFTSLNHIYTDFKLEQKTPSVVKSHSFKHTNSVMVNRYNRETREYNLPPSLPIVHYDDCDGKDLNVQIKKSSSLDSIKSRSKSPIQGDTFKSISAESVSSTKQKVIENNIPEMILPPKNIPKPVQSTVTISCNNNVQPIKSEQHVVTLSVTQTAEVEPPAIQPVIKIPVNKKPIIKDSPKTPPATTPTVPEFLKIQLNKVDAKPTTNIVLTTNVKETKITEKTETKTMIFKEENEINRNSLKEDVKPSVETTEVTTVEPKKVVERKMSSEPSTPTEVSSGEQTSFWKLNGSLKPKRQSSISLTPVTTPSSPTVPKPFVSKKSTSLEIIDKKPVKEENFKKPEEIIRKKSTGSTSSLVGSTGSINDENIVILRKKSIPVRNDEPELMKVFARRSLKLNTDGENLGQQVLVMLESIDKDLEAINSKNIKSRDSDKENEEIINTEPTFKQNTAIRLSTPKFPTTPRNSINENCKDNKKNVDNKNLWPTVPVKKPNVIEEIDVKKIDIIPKFKRIQQRKEEWEQRAQQAMKKSAVP